MNARSRRLLPPWISNAAAAVVFIVGLAFLARSARTFASSGQAHAPNVPRVVPNWRTFQDAGDVLVGETRQNGGTHVTITVFSDYQCPFCATAHATLLELQRQRAERVVVRMRHLPLTQLHPFAHEAAIAAKCAATQQVFAAFSAALFGDQARIGTVAMLEFARQAGVRDEKAFQACTRSDEPRRAVSADIEAARSLRIVSTPAILVQGRLYSGVPPLEVLLRTVDSLSPQNP